GGLGARAALPDGRGDVLERRARRRGRLDLLLHELVLERPVVGLRAADHVLRAGDGRAVVPDEHELFLDADGAAGPRHPGAHRRASAARASRVASAAVMRCARTMWSRLAWSRNATGSPRCTCGVAMPCSPARWASMSPTPPSTTPSSTVTTRSCSPHSLTRFSGTGST